MTETDTIQRMINAVTSYTESQQLNDDQRDMIVLIAKQHAANEVDRLLDLLTEDAAAQYVIDSGYGSQFSWRMEHHNDHAEGIDKASFLKHIGYSND